MALTGKLNADFSAFDDAVTKAERHLTDFSAGADRAGTRLSAMQDSFSGKAIFQTATLMTEAVERAGGAATLTASQMGRVNSTVTEAIAKYAALGQSAPANMLALADATKRVEAPTEGLSTKMVALGTFIGTMAANAVAWLGRLAMEGLRTVVGAIGELVTKGAELSGISQAFGVLAGSVNATGEAMLGAMRTGTRGLVVDLDLMKAANKAVLLGLPVTATEMGTLSATATALGRAMGLGPTQAFDDLITALGRSSPMILDNLGLTVKVGEANDKYAATLGKTAEQLTDAEKKTAFYNAAMDAARVKVGALGDAQLALGDRIAQAGVWWENFKGDLAVAIARSPVLNTALTELGAAFEQTFGTNTTARVATLNTGVSQVALRLVDLGSIGISTAKYITEGFYLLRGILFGVLESVTNIIAAMLGANAKLAEFMAGIPLIGSAWKGVAIDARYAADMMGSVAESFKTTKEEAFTAMGTAGAAFDSANAKLTAMRAAMERAAKEPIVLPATVERVKELAKAVPPVAAAVVDAAQKTEVWNSGLKFTTETIGALNPALDAAADRIQRMADAAKAAADANSALNKALSGVVNVTALNFADTLHAISAPLDIKGMPASMGWNPFGTLDEARGAELARLGYSMSELVYILQHPGIALPPPQGPRIPGFAGGVENYAGGWAMVGERGPEAMYVPQGASIFPSGSGGGSVTNIFNLYGTPAELVQKVKDAITRATMRTQKIGSA